MYFLELVPVMSLWTTSVYLWGYLSWSNNPSSCLISILKWFCKLFKSLNCNFAGPGGYWDAITRTVMASSSDDILGNESHAPLSERCSEQHSPKNGINMCVLLMKLKWVLMFPFSPYQSSKLINLHTHNVRWQIKIWFDVPPFSSAFTDLNKLGRESWSALTQVFFHCEIIASGRHLRSEFLSTVSAILSPEPLW